MKVAVFSTKPYDRQFLTQVNQKHHHELQFFSPSLDVQTVTLAAGFEAVCVFVNDRLDRQIMEILSQQGIKLIALRCAGYNNVDLDAARELEITVVRVPAYSPHAVAEHAIALILTLNRKIHRAYYRVREGNFALNGLLGFDLHGRTVGKVLLAGGILMGFVILFFIIGTSLPTPIPPASVALLGAAIALVISNQTKINTVNNVFKDIDWSTLLFFISTFVLIGGLEKTGVISSLSQLLAVVLGKNIALGSISLLFLVGLLSSVVPNIPLVVAMVPLLKQYLVNVGLIGTEFLNPDFQGQFPPEVLPLFYAMMFGATLGGNGTLMGASSNIVAAGVAELHGRHISFSKFLKYGIPVMIVQLTVSAVFITFAFIL